MSVIRERRVPTPEMSSASGALFFLVPPCRNAFPGPASQRPAKGAAAELPCRLLLPQAAATRKPGRGAFFLFGKAKRKNGGRITQAASSEQYLYTIYSIVRNPFTAMKPFSSLLTKFLEKFLAKSQKSS